MNPALIGALQSKTVWLGAIIAVIGFLQMNTDAFEPLLSAASLEAVLRGANVLVGAAVIFVRFLTDTSLADKAKE